MVPARAEELKKLLANDTTASWAYEGLEVDFTTPQTTTPMTTPTFFPILTNYTYKGPAKHPSTIPWSMVEKYNRQVQENHQQSLHRLAARGGLTVIELWYVMNETHPCRVSDVCKVTHEQACEWLNGLLNKDKLVHKSERTGILCVLDYEPTQEFFDGLNKLILKEGPIVYEVWMSSSGIHTTIDVHEFIVQTLFDDPYYKAIYDYFDKNLSYLWKAASHLRLKLPK